MASKPQATAPANPPRAPRPGPRQANRYFVFDAFDGRFCAWRPPAELPLPRAELAPAGRYLAALDLMEPDLGLRFVVTDAVGGPLPVGGPDVVVVCVKDEIARLPAYSQPVGMVFKSYGTERSFTRNSWAGASPAVARASSIASEAVVQARRGAGWLNAAHQARRHGSPPTADLPLGCLVEPSGAPKPSPERTIDVAFMGSVYTGERSRRLPSAKENARRQLTRALAAIEAEGSMSVRLSTTSTYFESQGNRPAYRETLGETRILPCPRGNSLETYRLFEALAFGCVPVVAGPLPAREYYDGAPIVRIADWSDLGAVCARLLGDPGRVAALQSAASAWWRERCSPEAVAASMIAGLRRSQVLHA